MLMVLLTHKIVVSEIITCQIAYVFHSIFLGTMEHNRTSNKIQLKGIMFLTLTLALRETEHLIISNHLTNKKD